MNEDRVKEIAAKICHEKMKGLYDHVHNKIKQEIIFEIKNGKIPLSCFFTEIELESIRSNLRSQIYTYVSMVVRNSFNKFSNLLKENN